MEQLNLFPAPDPSPLVRKEIAGMTRIEEMLNAGEKLDVILRQIALQMALVYQQSIEEVSKGRSQKPLLLKMRCYHELQRSILELHAHSTTDHLDLDGPKFKFVFAEILKLFQGAVRNAGVDAALGKSILMHFSGLVKENEDRIRAEVRRVNAV
jgi:hypothetical protein